MSTDVPKKAASKGHFQITDFEPFSYRNQLFGKLIEFYNEKQHVKFTSLYHDPDFLNYAQISEISIKYDPKKWLLYLGVFLLIVIVGIVIIYAKIHLPPWEMKILLKNGKPITVRAHFKKQSPEDVQRYLNNQINLKIIPKMD